MIWRSRPAGRKQTAAFDPAMRALRDAAADAQRSRLPQMAAALSYRTVFGLIPVLVVGLLAVRHFTSPEAQTELITSILERTGLSKISLHDTAGSGGPEPGWMRLVKGDNEIAGPPLSPDLVQERLSNKGNLEEWITALLARAENSVSFGAIGLVGVATLIYAAIAMVVEIERAFNQIFRVTQGRSWVRRVTNYWTLLTLGTAGLVATFWVGAKFQGWAAGLVQSEGITIGSGAFTVGLIGFGVTVLISTTFLTILYVTVPNTRVKVVPAVSGAFIAAVLWEAGKWGFSQYLLYSSSYARLYGSLALIPLFLVWVYFAWLIVLLGLATTYQLQYGLRHMLAQPITDLGPVVVEPAASLVVMSAIAGGFRSGKSRSATEIARTASVPEPIVQLVLAKMAERGLVHRLDTPGRAGIESTYVLARAPEAISAESVLRLGFDLAGNSGGVDAPAGEMGETRLPADGTIERLREAQLAAARGRTIADIAGPVVESHGQVPPGSAAVPGPKPGGRDGTAIPQ